MTGGLSTGKEQENMIETRGDRKTNKEEITKWHTRRMSGNQIREYNDGKGKKESQ